MNTDDRKLTAISITQRCRCGGHQGTIFATTKSIDNYAIVDEQTLKELSTVVGHYVGMEDINGDEFSTGEIRNGELYVVTDTEPVKPRYSVNGSIKKCFHEYDGQGISITANPTAKCKKCGQEYECDNTGKPHLIELLGNSWIRYQDGGRSIIKEKK